MEAISPPDVSAVFLDTASTQTLNEFAVSILSLSDNFLSLSVLHPSSHLIAIPVSSLNMTCFIWPCWRVSLIGYIPARANCQSNYWRRTVLITTRCANKVACSETTLQAFFFFSLVKSLYHFLCCRAVVQIHKNSGLILFESCFPMLCSHPSFIVSVQECQMEESLTLKNHCFDWTWII